MWYAIMDRRCIASAVMYADCSKDAARASGWDKAHNSVAPYTLTQLHPAEHMPPIPYNEPEQRRLFNDYATP